jgi:hypothetical protein
MWLYGSGFPKSHDVAKSIDKAARGVPHGGADPTSANHGKFKGGCSDDNAKGQGFGAGPGQFMREAGSAENRVYVSEAQAWQGWGTALKPAHEPIVVARKPLVGTVAQNVLAHGVGALNIDGCRVEAADKTPAPVGEYSRSEIGPVGHRGVRDGSADKLGRWPANVLHDGSEEVVRAFPDNAGGGSATPRRPRRKGSGWDRPCNDRHDAAKQAYDGQGSAARFFYQVKPDPVLEQSQRSASSDLEHESHRLNSGFDSRDGGQSSRLFYTAKADTDDRLGSKHPTIKPLDLMQYLIRLVTPKGGVVLDPFAGSGTTGEAAVREGCRAILCEREPEYLTDIERRCALILAGPDSRRHATLKTKGKVEDAGPLFGALA